MRLILALAVATLATGCALNGPVYADRLDCSTGFINPQPIPKEQRTKENCPRGNPREMAHYGVGGSSRSGSHTYQTATGTYVVSTSGSTTTIFGPTK